MKKIIYCIVLTLLCDVFSSCKEDDIDEFNGHRYVDLGLPSGLKWATCNVGASSPEECGDFFSWGETEPKKDYNWSTYKWINGTENSITKYCVESSFGTFGTVDNKTVLDPQDDAAHVNWGGAWRMPTRDELDELREKCVWTWTSQNGVEGYKVWGPNGNSIFLLVGAYWSSSLYLLDESNSAYCLSILPEYFEYWGGFRLRSGDRYNGLSVRPVCQ